MKCEYGCEQEAMYQLRSGKWCCSERYTACPELRRKNSEGLKRAYADNERRNLFAEAEFSQHRNKNVIGKNIFTEKKCQRKTTPDKVFIENSTAPSGMIKQWIIENKFKAYKCDECDIVDWKKNPISLELHHKNGNRRDNRLENLQLLCPNCHSQTDTFKGRGIKKRVTVSDEVIIEAVNSCQNIRQVLLKIGMDPKGCNYSRVRDVMFNHKIDFDPK